MHANPVLENGVDVKSDLATLDYVVRYRFNSVKILLPYLDVEESLKNNEQVQEFVKKELNRLQAVKKV